jgi:small redox-active disulfide protein 2
VEVVVYGPGCGNCRRLETQTREALTALGQDTGVTKVTDLVAMAEAGVMRTPALGVNGAILLQGRIPEVAELSRTIAAVLPPAADR